MSILNFPTEWQFCDDVRVRDDYRCKSDPYTDLKEGIELILDLKFRLDRFHPLATETLIQLLAQ